LLACLLLLPASIQLAHAFEQHENVICVSDVEHHFHQDDVECILCHLQAENHLVTFSNDYDVIPTTFYKVYTDKKPLGFVKVYVTKKSSRGPPNFTV